MIVVDTNVIAYLYLPGDRTADAEALLLHDPDWNAPLLWRSELRSVLAGCMRRGVMTFDHAREVQAKAESLLAGGEYAVDSRRVLALVRDSECTSYDCEFVALAMDLDTQLVTMDAMLLKAFPGRARALA